MVDLLESKKRGNFNDLVSVKNKYDEEKMFW